jgi:hypothetical protein
MTFRADDSDGDKSLLAPPLPQTSLDAIALLGADTSAPLNKSKVDLVVRERDTAAEFFQPVELTREKVAVEGRDGFFRQILRANGEVDPLTAANGAELGSGIWDVLIRLSSCGWTKETRLGSVRADGVRQGRTGALVGSPERLVLPYWTDPHGNLSLDVGQKTNRLSYDLAGLTPADVTVAGAPARLTAALPLHVQGKADVTLKLTGLGESPTSTVPAVLADRPAGGAELTADLPVDELADGQWRLELTLPAAGKEKPAALALALQAEGGTLVVKPVTAVAATLAAKGPERRKPPVLARKSLLRRAVGKLRRTLKK